MLEFKHSQTLGPQNLVRCTLGMYHLDILALVRSLDELRGLERKMFFRMVLPNRKMLK